MIRNTLIKVPPPNLSKTNKRNLQLEPMRIIMMMINLISQLKSKRFQVYYKINQESSIIKMKNLTKDSNFQQMMKNQHQRKTTEALHFQLMMNYLIQTNPLTIKASQRRRVSQLLVDSNYQRTMMLNQTKSRSYQIPRNLLSLEEDFNYLRMMKKSQFKIIMIDNLIIIS